MPETRPVARPYAPTALPSVTARALAFLAIIVGGVCGGLIAYAITDLQCGRDDGRAQVVLPAPPQGGAAPAASPAGDETGEGPANEGCVTISGAAGLLGATVSAASVAVVAVLVLRAMAEWRRDLPVTGFLEDRGG